MATAQNMDRTSRRGLTQGPTEQAVWFAIQEHGNQPPADLFNGDGQDPVLKRRAIAQDARLAPQYSNIMPQTPAVRPSRQISMRAAYALNSTGRPTALLVTEYRLLLKRTGQVFVTGAVQA